MHAGVHALPPAHVVIQQPSVTAATVTDSGSAPLEDWQLNTFEGLLVALQHLMPELWSLDYIDYILPDVQAYYAHTSSIHSTTLLQLLAATLLLVFPNCL